MQFGRNDHKWLARSYIFPPISQGTLVDAALACTYRSGIWWWNKFPTPSSRRLQDCGVGCNTGWQRVTFQLATTGVGTSVTRGGDSHKTCWTSRPLSLSFCTRDSRIHDVTLRLFCLSTHWAALGLAGMMPDSRQATTCHRLCLCLRQAGPTL